MGAFRVLKRLAEGLYNASCTVWEMKTQKGSVNNPMAEITAENIPCRVSFSSSPKSENSETASTLNQGVRLFLTPNVAIKAGSTVVVTQNGQKTTYTCAGESAVYESHQEVNLRLKKEQA